jgi:Zn-dependent protease with chaperone function/uncharacterized tellurite resistance protein B-like protein
MEYSKIGIALEAKIGKELYDLMEGPVVEKVIREAKIERFQNEWKLILEGHSFKVTEKMASGLYSMFRAVEKKLGFEEPIEYFITNSPELNAFSLSRIEDDQPHIININSGLIRWLDNDELLFVIGHEIGHLITRNANIMRLIQFIFPDPSNTPLILQHKITLWKKLSELTADRYGYLASPKPDKCISAFFKLASGLDTGRINFDYEAYMAENDVILDYFRKEIRANLMSHPINPIRIKALQYFSQSDLVNGKSDWNAGGRDEKLDAQINELIDILLTMSNSELDEQRRLFLASAGLIMAGADGQINQDEYKKIIRELSEFTIFPKAFLDQVYQSAKVEEIFSGSVAKIMEINPADRYPLFDFLINLAIFDNDLAEKEVAFLYHVGQEMFRFAPREIAQMIAGKIQSGFMPNVYAR